MIALLCAAYAQEMTDTEKAVRLQELAVERLKLEAELAAKQARLDQVNGEMARLEAEFRSTPLEPFSQRFTAAMVEPWYLYPWALRTLLNASTDDFNACLGGEAMQLNGDFVIGTNGYVAGHLDLRRLDGGEVDPTAYACFDDTIRSIEFPAPRKNVVATFLFG
jgi:hypothetical protein